MCLWNDLANTFTSASEFFFSPFPLGTEFHSSLGEKAYKKFLLGCEYQLSICPAYDHRGAKIYVYILLNILSCFGQDKQQALPAEWNPMDTKGIDREGTKHTTLSRSSPASKDNQRENRRRQFPWELATVHRILAASGVQLTFLSSHILAAPPIW